MQIEINNLKEQIAATNTVLIEKSEEQTAHKSSLSFFTSNTTNDQESQKENKSLENALSNNLN